VYSDSRVIVSNSTFFRDHGDNGGAIRCNLNSNCLIRKCNFSDSYSTYSGGAISVASGSSTLVRGGFFENTYGKTVNSFVFVFRFSYFTSRMILIAATGGAFHFTDSSNFFSKDVFIYKSKSDFFGGVVFISHLSNATFLNLSVKDCSSPEGAFSLIQASSGVYVTNSNFNGLYAQAYGALAVVEGQSKFEVYDTSVSSVKSSLEGGGIHSTLSFVKMENCRVQSSLSNR